MSPTQTPTGTTIATTVLDTPVGQLSIGVTVQGVRYVLWPDERRSLRLADVGSAQSATADEGAAVRHELLAAVVEQLDAYFAGERTTFDLPLDPVGTPFQQQVWGVLRTIPYAATMSYGEQARALGDPNKARAVGAANGRNPISIIVPCHRVVGKQGTLTGFAGGLDAKAWLLDHERRVAATR